MGEITGRVMRKAVSQADELSQMCEHVTRWEAAAMQSKAMRRNLMFRFLADQYIRQLS